MSKNHLILPWWAWAAAALIAAAALLAHLSDARELPLFQHTLETRPHLLIRDRNDDHPIAVSRALEGRNIDTPVIYVVGTSVAREALFLQDHLEQRLGENADNGHVTLRNLSTSTQRFLESFFLVELSAPKPGNIYYFYISPQSFFWHEKGNKHRLEKGDYLLSASHFYQTTLIRYLPENHVLATTPFREERYMSGKFVRIYLNNALSNAINQSVLGGKHPEYLRHARDLPLDSNERRREWRAITQNKEDRLNEGAKHFEMNMNILEATLSYLHDRGARVYVLAPPTAPDILSSEYLQITAAALDRLCNRADGPTCVDLNEAAQLSETDFNDPVHVNSRGRHKWSEAFIELVKSSR